MRVAVIYNAVFPVSTYGGTERVVWWLAKGLTEKGHSVTLICRDGSQCPYATTFPVDFGNFNEALFPEADNFHYFFSPPARPPHPYIVTIGGNGQVGEAYEPNTVFVSHNHAVRHGATAFVYNGLDPDEYVFRERKSDYLIFLAKASWKVKNVAGAIRLAKQSGEKLRILGGNRRFRLPAKNIRWEGMVGGVGKAEIVAGAKGLLFPVLWHEPFGLAVTESLVSGTPVLATPFGSLPELVGNDVGHLCLSEQEFLEWIPQLGQFDARRCRDWVYDKFHYRQMTAKYLAYYDQVGRGLDLNIATPRADERTQQSVQLSVRTQ